MFELEETADCPGAYGEDVSCVDSNDHRPVFGFTPVYFSLCSCIASMIGSVLMIIPYILWKDIRSGLRKIVTYLAVADFFTAFGYTIASFNYIHYHDKKDEDYPEACWTFSAVCQIQAYVSSWASLSSFWWTAILAYYLYTTIIKGNTNVLNKWFPFFHVLVWGSPILVMLPLLLTDSLGYSLFSAGGWCFISGDRHTGHTRFYNYDLSWLTIVKILAGGKAIEIATYVWVIVLYGIIYCNLRAKKKFAVSTEEQSEGFVDLLKRMERKLYAIPIAFILVRIWGTLQFIFSIAIFAHGGLVDATGCVSKPIFYTFYFFACIQSIGDGAQGWCNAILYIIFSPKIRLRLLRSVLSPVCSCLYGILGLAQTSTTVNVFRPNSVSTIQYKSKSNTKINVENTETGNSSNII